jgi:heme A synthase
VKRTTRAPESAPWLNAAYWAVIAALIVLGVINILGAFGSSAQVVSYVTFGIAVTLIMTRLVLLRRRANRRN